MSRNSDSQYIYIDPDVNIKTGDEARKALEHVNDDVHVTEGAGITQVPLERWRDAQHAERIHWMKLGLRNWNDRNDEHFDKFEQYTALQDRAFNRVLEVGCGPYTNLSIIGGVCKVASAYLLDPLINDYLAHPYCMYTSQRLILRRPRTPYFQAHRLLSRFAPSLHQRLFKQMIAVGDVQVRGMMAIPAEELPSNLEHFDLIVAINVIEHCYDIHRVLASLAHLKPGGVLVFQDKYYDHEEVSRMVKSVYDAAHPLKVDRKVVDSFLKSNFRPIFEKVYRSGDRVNDFTHSYEELYFIGEKV